MYKGINNALEYCKGKVIGYINSDDLFEDKKNFKRIQYAFLHQNIDCIYSGYKVKNLETGFSKNYIPLKFKNRYLITLGMPFCQHTFFWHQKFKNQRFDLKYKVCSDFDFIGKILIKSRRIGYLNINSSIFHKRRESFGEKNKIIGLYVTKKIKKFFNKINLTYFILLIDFKILIILNFMTINFI